MKEQLHQALKKFFGFDEFLDGQYKAIAKFNEGKDVCLVMPTGAGKSICYQLPALLKPGYTIVISPLIALMKDQVDNLQRKGIPAIYINSSLTPREQHENMQRVMRGEAKLLYVAPERLKAANFRQAIINQPPDCLVVDEAHCISEWGHDFRPDYKRLGEFCQTYKIPQVCAFTATATPLVREDIKKQLKRDDMEFMVTGFTRPNLSFSVVEANGARKKDILRKYLAEKKPTLIYCASRKNVDEVAQAFGIRAYHAGLSDKDRHDAQEYFINDPCPMMAATNAFGMGIDRADIRRVIHYNFPGSIEAYYQEAGRAGRDGEQSECVMLYSFADKFIHEFLIELNNPGKALVNEVWAQLRRLQSSSDNGRIETPQSAIADKVPSAKSETQISGALKILEDSGYVNRGYRQDNKGFLKVDGNLDALYTEHSNTRTQRSIFLSRAIYYWRDQISNGMKVTYRDLEQMSGLNSDQLKRVLRALKGTVLNWEAPFSGRSLTLKKEDVKLEIDFTELNKKADSEYDKLDKVLAYVSCRSCRQDYMINYFGQNRDSYRCQTCDRCTSSKQGVIRVRSATDGERRTITIVLRAVENHNGFIGKVKLAQILSGSKNKQLFDAKLDRSKFYDKLPHLDQTDIIEHIDNLERSQYIERSRGKYPTISLTDKGSDVIHGAGDIKMEFKQKASSQKAPTSNRSSRDDGGPLFSNNATTSKSAPAQNMLDDILYDKLRDLRNKVAKEQGKQPFMIFNNLSLKDMATNKPTSPQALKKVHGCGDVKVHMFGEDFLKVIKKHVSK